MKKLFAWAAAILLTAGCAGKQAPLPQEQSDQNPSPQAQTSPETPDPLGEKAARLWELEEPVWLDQEQLAALLGLEEEALAGGWGVVSAREESPDALLFVSPAAGAEEQAEKCLEERLAFVLEAFPGEGTMGTIFFTAQGPVLAVTGADRDLEALEQLLKETLGAGEP